MEPWISCPWLKRQWFSSNETPIGTFPHVCVCTVCICTCDSVCLCLRFCTQCHSECVWPAPSPAASGSGPCPAVRQPSGPLGQPPRALVSQPWPENQHQPRARNRELTRGGQTDTRIRFFLYTRTNSAQANTGQLCLENWEKGHELGGYRHQFSV